MYYLQAPNYPDSGRCWDIVDKYKVTIFYTAPTLVRSLMRDGDQVSYVWTELCLCGWNDLYKYLFIESIIQLSYAFSQLCGIASTLSFVILVNLGS